MTVYSNNIALCRNLKKNLNILSNFCIVHDYIGTLHGIMCKTYVDKETCLCLWSLYYNVFIYKKNRYDSITTCTLKYINELHVHYPLLFQTQVYRKKTKGHSSVKQNTS